ncbi:hypothetical protein [Rhizobium gallicum]|uniref:hypothetical protein n=1 Tax=Rhizobium gallicum TaxID=56730 RepID=UPI001EF7A60A|nr:hypothetical protein [Rhizobium gallicum]ULJ76154.1 hypothetical protein L2W42_27365 [Rhizobium gallicum]
MYTYEDRIRVNEIELYVPSISLEDVDFNALEFMVFRTRMMRAIASVDDRYQLLGVISPVIKRLCHTVIHLDDMHWERRTHLLLNFTNNFVNRGRNGFQGRQVSRHQGTEGRYLSARSTWEHEDKNAVAHNENPLEGC